MEKLFSKIFGQKPQIIQVQLFELPVISNHHRRVQLQTIETLLLNILKSVDIQEAEGRIKRGQILIQIYNHAKRWFIYEQEMYNKLVKFILKQLTEIIHADGNPKIVEDQFFKNFGLDLSSNKGPQLTIHDVQTLVVLSKLKNIQKYEINRSQIQQLMNKFLGQDQLYKHEGGAKPMVCYILKHIFKLHQKICDSNAILTSPKFTNPLLISVLFQPQVKYGKKSIGRVIRMIMEQLHQNLSPQGLQQSKFQCTTFYLQKLSEEVNKSEQIDVWAQKQSLLRNHAFLGAKGPLYVQHSKDVNQGSEVQQSTALLQQMYQIIQTMKATNNNIEQSLYCALFKCDLNQHDTIFHIIQACLMHLVQQLQQNEQVAQTLISICYLSLEHFIEKFCATEAEMLSSQSQRVHQNRYLDMMKFFSYGYQSDSQLFVRYCKDKLLPTLKTFAEMFTNQVNIHNVDRSVLVTFVEYLQVCMDVHQGHPDIYLEIQTTLAAVCQSYKIDEQTPQQISVIKQRNIWMALEQQNKYFLLQQGGQPNKAISTETQSQQKIENYRTKGLQNLGNTCYLNSCIQMLYNIDEVKEDLIFNGKYPAQGLKLFKSSFYQMRRLFILLSAFHFEQDDAYKYSSRPSLIPQSLRQTLPTYFHTFQQQDAGECMRVLLDQVEKDEVDILKNQLPPVQAQVGAAPEIQKPAVQAPTAPPSELLPQQDIASPEIKFEDQAENMQEDGIQETINQDAEQNIQEEAKNEEVKNEEIKTEEKATEIDKEMLTFNRYIMGSQQQEITCLECNQQSVTKDNFIDISLAVPTEKQDLQTCIDQHFQPEELSQKNDNQYFCSKCEKHVEKAEKKLVLNAEKMPGYLILMLNRFQYEKGGLKKVMTEIEVNSEITLLRKYRLHSCIIHAGNSANYGHYYCIKTTSATETEVFNDAQVSHHKHENQTENYVNKLQGNFKSDTPYILCYKMVLEDEEMTPGGQNGLMSMKEGHSEEIKQDIKTVVDTDAKLYVKQLENEEKQRQQQAAYSQVAQMQNLLRQQRLQQSWFEQDGIYGGSEYLREFDQIESKMREEENKKNKSRRNYDDFNGPSQGGAGFYDGRGPGAGGDGIL